MKNLWFLEMIWRSFRHLLNWVKSIFRLTFSWSTYSSFFAIPALKFAAVGYPLLGHYLIREIERGYSFEKNTLCRFFECAEGDWSNLLNWMANNILFLLYYSLFCLSVSVLIFSLTAWGPLKEHGNLSDFKLAFPENASKQAFINRAAKKYGILTEASYSEKLVRVFMNRDLTLPSFLSILFLLVGASGVVINAVLNILLVTLNILSGGPF